MSGADEDDKPTVVLDLNALKKQKLKQEEDLANIASELEFNIPPEGEAEAASAEDLPPVKSAGTNSKITPPAEGNTPVILFDFGSDFFQKSQAQFPKGFAYKVIKTLPELNQCLKNKGFQIVVFNYDGNPKAVNQLCAQIKAKMPTTKTMIMAKAISPEKAKAHAKTASGAAGYYQYPLEAAKIQKEFQRIQGQVKKVS
jgi:hypothetical protein